MNNLSLLILTFFLSLGILHADIEEWESSDGRKMKMELLEVMNEDGAVKAKFKVGGRVKTLSPDIFTEDGQAKIQAKLDEQAEAEALAEADKNDVFMEDLENALVVLDGKKFDRVKDFTPPKKYYLFYKTASWCPPCQQFTPTLVKFYKENKEKYGDDFEIILVTSDQDENAMLKYAIDKKMEWPHIDLKKVERFKRNHSLPGSGIPNVLVFDREGKILKKSYEGSKYVGPTAPMKYLKTLLDKES